MRPGSPFDSATSPSPLAAHAPVDVDVQAPHGTHPLLALLRASNTLLPAAYDAHLRRMLDTAARHHLDEFLAHTPFPPNEPQRASCLAHLLHAALSRMGRLTDEERQAPPPLPLNPDLRRNLDIDEFADSQAASLSAARICRDLARQTLEELREADRSNVASAASLQGQVAALDRRFGFSIPASALLTRDGPGQEPVLVRDPSLLGRHLWSALRRPEAAARPWCCPLPALGDPVRPPRLEIDSGHWARIIEPCAQGQRQRAIGIADLPLIQQACLAANTTLTDEQRALLASTAIGASTARERQSFPPDWLVSHQIAREFLTGMSDEDVHRWLREVRVPPDSATCRHLASAAVADWRHGLVMGALPDLGKRTAIEAMKRDPYEDDEDSLRAGRQAGNALIRGDAERLRHITRAVLGAIGPQLSGDEAVDIFWPNRSDFPPLILGLFLDKPPALMNAHLDDLVEAVRDGRLASRHLVDLLGGADGKPGVICGRRYGPAARHLLTRARDLTIQGLLTRQEFQRLLFGDPAHPVPHSIRLGPPQSADRRRWERDLDAFQRAGLVPLLDDELPR